MLFESFATAGMASRFVTYDNILASSTLEHKRVEAWSFGQGIWDDSKSFSVMTQKDCPHLHAMDMGHKLLSEPTDLSHDTTSISLYDDLYDDYDQVWTLTRMFTLCECKDEELNPQRSCTSTHIDDWLASSASTTGVEAECPVGGKSWSNDRVLSPWIFPLAIEDIDDDSPLSSPSMHSGYITAFESPILSPNPLNEMYTKDIRDDISCWSCTAEVGDESDIIHAKRLGLTAPVDSEKSAISVSDQDTCVARMPQYELPIHCPKPTRAWEYKKLLGSSWPSLLTEAINMCAQMHFSVTY